MGGPREARVYAALLLVLALAWVVLTATTLPDGFPAEFDPYGYRTLIAHGVLPSLAVPVGLWAWRRGAFDARQTLAVVLTPLVVVGGLAVLWASTGAR